jgi:hypothetical protein
MFRFQVADLLKKKPDPIAFANIVMRSKVAYLEPLGYQATYAQDNFCSVVFSVHFRWLGVQMSSRQQRLIIVNDTRLAVVINAAVNFKTQLFELDRLREQVRKAELRIAASSHCLRGGLNRKPLRNRSENLRSVSPT